jgi:hypothetical protein
MDVFQGLTLALGVFSLIMSGFAFVVWSKISEAAQKAEEARDEADAKCDKLREDLAEFKLRVAREYPLRDELRDIARNVETGFKTVFEKMEKIGHDINEMGNTFRDRLNEKEDRK